MRINHNIAALNTLNRFSANNGAEPKEHGEAFFWSSY